MTATVTHLPVTQPHPAPSRWAAAVATATLDAGCGPEQVPWLVAGFEHAPELEREIRTALAAMSPLEAHLSSAGCAAIWAASGPS